MKTQIEKILSEFGDSVTVRQNGTSTTVRAFLQPVTSKSWQNMEHVFAGLGRVERGQYLYLGPADVLLAQGDCLLLRDTAYVVRKAEPITAADTVLYCWALCVRKGGDDPWNN